MGVWAIYPGHMLFKLENRVIIMPFLRHCNGTFFIFTIIYFNAQRGRKENFYVSNHLFTREADLGSSDHAGKEQQHHLHDSGHLLPPEGSGREQRNRILFLLFQFISGRPPDQSRSKKVNRSDYHWRAGAASLHSSEREKPGETELRPQRGCQRLAVCTYDL